MPEGLFERLWIDRTMPVLIEDWDKPAIDTPLGAAIQGTHGTITVARGLLNYEIGFLETASFNIKRATPKEMEHAIKMLDDRIAQMANTINRVLNEYGDTDPRHGAEGVDVEG